jgi:CheY-like chemotaxis protein
MVVAIEIIVKNVLIVDDEKPFLLSLTDGLAAHAKDFQVVTALNGKEAVKVLDSTAVNLVVTDLRMPKMDGFELLAHMSGSYPAIPVIVMTAYGTPEIEERLRNMGDFQYLEKPLDLNVLAERIFDALEAGSSPDRIHGISLAAFLQLLEMENKTCTLTVKSRGEEGHLYFVKGVLMQANTGEKRGEEAALDIVAWDNVAMEIQYTCTVKKKSIELPLAEILMEGFRIKDEKEGLEKSKEKNDKEDHVDGEIKEVIKMDVKKLNKAMEALKEDLGDGLIYADIFSTVDGQAIVAHNPNPVADALFTKITTAIIDAFKTLTERERDKPKIGRYIQIDLEDQKVATVMPLGDYIWGTLVDTNKVQVGLLNNVVIPKAIRLFEEAHKG